MIYLVFQSKINDKKCINGLSSSILAIFVINGKRSPGISEVVDIKKKRNCRPFANYPIPVYKATGTGTKPPSSPGAPSPFICGGWDGQLKKARSECYYYNFRLNTWKNVANMTTPRFSHASASIPGGLWITGGMTENSPSEIPKYRNLETSEFVLINGSVMQGPSFPVKISGHCMVPLNEGREGDEAKAFPTSIDKVMILGFYKNTSSRSINYDDKNKSFVYGPAMKVNRTDFACTSFKSQKHAGRSVVVAIGGVGSNNYEILDYTQKDAVWELSE